MHSSPPSIDNICCFSSIKFCSPKKLYPNVIPASHKSEEIIKMLQNVLERAKNNSASSESSIVTKNPFCWAIRSSSTSNDAMNDALQNAEESTDEMESPDSLWIKITGKTKAQIETEILVQEKFDSGENGLKYIILGFVH